MRERDRTLAIAVSSSSMKVASVTVTAMIHGLIRGRVSAISGTGIEAAATLMEHSSALMQQETVRSHLISGRLGLGTDWS